MSGLAPPKRHLPNSPWVQSCTVIRKTLLLACREKIPFHRIALNAIQGHLCKNAFCQKKLQTGEAFLLIHPCSNILAALAAWLQSHASLYCQRVSVTMRQCFMFCLCCRPQALILSPTRELAVQTQKNIQIIGENLKVVPHACIGGKSIGASKLSLPRLSFPLRGKYMSANAELIYRDISLAALAQTCWRSHAWISHPHRLWALLYTAQTANERWRGVQWWVHSAPLMSSYKTVSRKSFIVKDLL